MINKRYTVDIYLYFISKYIYTSFVYTMMTNPFGKK